MKTLTKPLPPSPWHGVRELLRARGLRWTPQRRSLIDVLARSEGHLSGAEILRRCREADPLTTPSTVYRTLDVLELLGLVRHGHGAGRDGGVPPAPVRRAWPSLLLVVRSWVGAQAARRQAISWLRWIVSEGSRSTCRT